MWNAPGESISIYLKSAVVRTQSMMFLWREVEYPSCTSWSAVRLVSLAGKLCTWFARFEIRTQCKVHGVAWIEARKLYLYVKGLYPDIHCMSFRSQTELTSQNWGNQISALSVSLCLFWIQNLVSALGFPVKVALSLESLLRLFEHLSEELALPPKITEVV